MPWLLLIIKAYIVYIEFYIRHPKGPIARPVTFWWPVSLRNTPLSKEVTDYTPVYTVMLS